MKMEFTTIPLCYECGDEMVFASGHGMDCVSYDIYECVKKECEKIITLKTRERI